MQIISDYFPDLDSRQINQIKHFHDLFSEWNTKINLVSRKDIDNLYERHILHSLSIAKIINFTPRTEIMDIGTGGGFPGIPLAIFFPECKFYLIDSIGKKIKVVNILIEALKLANVRAEQLRAEEADGKYDFVVSRAVADLSIISSWVKNKIKKQSSNKLSNGLICLKGGNIENEINPFGSRATIFNLDKLFHEKYFKDKKIVHIIQTQF
jgi:16S rRNA (guanine527-N7)-methyltransferase